MNNTTNMLVDQNAKKVPAFVLMQAEMTDQESFFHRYAVPAEVEISAHGGQAQVATFGKSVLEGKWDNNWAIVLRFPSLSAATTWYHSPGYQAVVPIRQAATAYGNMVMFEGMPESLLNWRVARYQGARAELRFPLTLDPTPEYIVTVAPAWNEQNGTFSVSASFAETDARQGKLSVEIKAAPEYVSDGHMVTGIVLRDAAGRRRTLGRVNARDLAAGQWQRIEFASDARADRDEPSDFDLAKVCDVEFDFFANGKAASAKGDIQIRNLALAK